MVCKGFLFYGYYHTHNGSDIAMTDLHRKELEDFRSYGVTFLGNKTGQRVLADLIDTFHYNNIVVPHDAQTKLRPEMHY